MAHVNLVTGKIYGCEKGSKTYYHEQAHLYYEETKRGRSIRIQQTFFLDALISSMALTIIYSNIFTRALVLVFLLCKIFSQLIEEYDCWIYAENKLRGKRDDRISKRKT